MTPKQNLHFKPNFFFENVAAIPVFSIDATPIFMDIYRFCHLDPKDAIAFAAFKMKKKYYDSKH